jgi:hypothetical protein
MYVMDTHKSALHPLIPLWTGNFNEQYNATIGTIYYRLNLCMSKRKIKLNKYILKKKTKTKAR